MRHPSTPLGIFTTLSAVFLPAGAGLTAPVWLMVMGVKLDKAAQIGARIVGVTALACLALGAAYWFVIRPRLETSPAEEGTDMVRQDTGARDRFVHTLVWCLFVVPFVLVIISFIIGQVETLSID